MRSVRNLKSQRPDLQNSFYPEYCKGSVSLQAVWLGDVPHDDGGEAELEGLQIVPVHLSRFSIDRRWYTKALLYVMQYNAAVNLLKVIRAYDY